MTASSRLIFPCVLLVLCWGCTVGPDFQRPPAPEVQRYVAETSVPDAYSLQFGVDPDVQWWQGFQSPEINVLVAQVLAANPDLKAAQAGLRAALESAAAARGAYAPSVTAALSSTRQQDATGTLSPTLNSGASMFSLHTGELDVSYGLDLWGGNRRQVESLVAQAEAQRYVMQATGLTLIANTVVSAITAAAARDQASAAERAVRDDRSTLVILQRLYARGAVAQLAVDAQVTALAQSEAALPALQQQQTQQLDLIAALTGRYSAQLPPQQLDLAKLQLPSTLPVSLPSRLAQRRPDIRQAEAQLHAATAQVGIATAAMLPNITLSADAGTTAVQLSGLGSAGTGYWSFGGALSQTLFAGRSLVHQRRAAIALLDQAGQNYRSVVLQAFRQVADALAALQADTATLAAQRRAQAAAAAGLELVKRNLELGAASDLEVLQAQRAYDTATQASIQARAAQLCDAVALYQALGGGDWRGDSAGALQ